MNFLEFVSDRHVSLNFERFKLRTFAVSSILMGSLSEKNQAIIPITDNQGVELVKPRGLSSEPYVEVGYGIDNILRFFMYWLFLNSGFK